MYFRYELVNDILRFRFAVLFVLKSVFHRIYKSCEDTDAADRNAQYLHHTLLVSCTL